jgi:hypothetical protein
MIRTFCAGAGIEAPVPKWKASRDCQRILEKFQTEQRVQAEALISQTEDFAGEFSLDKEYLGTLLEALVEDGWIERVATEKFRLTNGRKAHFPFEFITLGSHLRLRRTTRQALSLMPWRRCTTLLQSALVLAHEAQGSASKLIVGFVSRLIPNRSG